MQTACWIPDTLQTVPQFPFKIGSISLHFTDEELGSERRKNVPRIISLGGHKIKVPLQAGLASRPHAASHF